MGGWYTHGGTYTSGRGKGCQHRTCTTGGHCSYRRQSQPQQTSHRSPWRAAAACPLVSVWISWRDGEGQRISPEGSRIASLLVTSSNEQLTPALRSGTLRMAMVSCTPGDVTDTLLGWTRTCTHLFSSSAKPCGAEAPGQDPSRQHLCCSTHQPQCGSPEPRHAAQLRYCSQVSTGSWLTCFSLRR